MIPKETISEIIEKADIVSVVRDYVSLRKRGTNYMGLCPFHNEKTPSFSVSPEKNIWHCFGCNQGGNAISFISKIENFNFIDSVKLLAANYGVTINIDNNYVDRNAPLIDAVTKAADFFHSLLYKTEGKFAHDYLINRGLSDENFKQLKLGYAPKNSGLFLHLKKLGLSTDNIFAAGLLIKRDNGEFIDRFQDRITFPIQNLSGDIIAFGARIIPNQNNNDKMAKYINSAENELYHKGRVVYGLNLSREYIKKEKSVLLVEGYMDYLTCFVNGVKSVAATLGTAMTIDQARLIKRYTSDVIIGYDTDDAGINAAMRAADILLNLDMHVRIVEYSHKDPDQVVQKLGVEALKEQINNSRPYVMFKLDNIVAKYSLAVPENVNRAVAEAADFLLTINTEVLADNYVKYVAGKLKISEESVYSRMKQSRYYKKRGGDDHSRIMPQQKNDKYIKAQEIVIRIISNNVNLRLDAAKELSADCFTDEGLKLLYGVICSSFAPANDLLETLTDETIKNRFAGIIIDDNTEEVKGFWDNLKVLKEYPNKKKLKLLEKSIKDAQENQNTEVLNDLLLEYNTLMLGTK